MDNALVAPLFALLAVPLGLVVGWLLNRKKNVAEVVESISGASHDVVESMRWSMEALQHRLDETTGALELASDKIEQLANQKDSIMRELSALTHQNRLLLEENHVMRGRLDRIDKKITDTGEILSDMQSSPHGN